MSASLETRSGWASVQSASQKEKMAGEAGVKLSKSPDNLEKSRLIKANKGRKITASEWWVILARDSRTRTRTRTRTRRIKPAEGGEF